MKIFSILFDETNNILKNRLAISAKLLQEVLDKWTPYSLSEYDQLVKLIVEVTIRDIYKKILPYD